MASVPSSKVVRLKSVTAAGHNVVHRKPSRSPFSTASKPLHSRPLALQTSQRPSIAKRIPPQALLAPSTILIRHASSTPAANQASIPDDVLTWDRFFDLRRKRRYVNLGCSLLTAGASIGVFGPVIAQQDIDGWAAQISGLDPFIVLGISTFAIATGGWLCGPTFGNGMFKLWAGRRGWNLPIAEKEKSFFARVRRYRADPSSSSPQNPIPDYYGEKIGSVKDYRRWLKDQRAFNLKKNKNMI